MRSRARRILAVVPLLMWFGLLMPAHQHEGNAHAEAHREAHRAESACHGEASHGHDLAALNAFALANDASNAPAPDDDHDSSHCDVCHFSSQLTGTLAAPAALERPVAATRWTARGAQQFRSTTIPHPFDGRAPPRA